MFGHTLGSQPRSFCSKRQEKHIRQDQLTMISHNVPFIFPYFPLFSLWVFRFSPQKVAHPWPQTWPSRLAPTSHGLCGDPVQGKSTPTSWQAPGHPGVVPGILSIKNGIWTYLNHQKMTFEQSNHGGLNHQMELNIVLMGEEPPKRWRTSFYRSMFIGFNGSTLFDLFRAALDLSRSMMNYKTYDLLTMKYYESYFGLWLWVEFC